MCVLMGDGVRPVIGVLRIRVWTVGRAVEAVLVAVEGEVVVLEVEVEVEDCCCCCCWVGVGEAALVGVVELERMWAREGWSWVITVRMVWSGRWGSQVSICSVCNKS